MLLLCLAFTKTLARGNFLYPRSEKARFEFGAEKLDSAMKYYHSLSLSHGEISPSKTTKVWNQSIK